MAGNSTKFDEFLTSEVRKYKGIYVPVRASLLERLFVKKLSPEKIHPNPDDDFCDPRVGPNYGIISNYEQDIREARQNPAKVAIAEPLIVEKIRPDGYMLFNGHHRWAAAKHMGMKKVPVSVVNVTHEGDIREMLKKSKNEKRVTLDLDEVVFATEGEPCEKNLSFPFSLVFKHRLRLGVPALFFYFKKASYDIWVYSANYYSLEYIDGLFRHYNVSIDGIDTGTGRKQASYVQTHKKLSEMIAQHYTRTLHIDARSVVCINNQTHDFREYPLNGSADDWSKGVLDIVKGIEKGEVNPV